MYLTISQILYQNRRAFFEKLAQSLPSQPAVKDWTSASPDWKAQARIAQYAKSGAD